MPYRIENYHINPKLPICKQLIEYYDYCSLECHYTTDTMTGKISSINHFVRATGIKKIQKLTNEMLSEYIRKQAEQQLQPRTINNRTKHILAMVGYFTDEKDLKIPHFNAKKVKKQREERSNKRAFDRETIYEALRYADRQAWLLIKIGFDCGLRICELQRMRLSDLKGSSLLVHGKGRKERFVVLSDEVVVRLNDWIKRKHVTDYLWESNAKNHSGSPQSRDTLRRIMQDPFKSTTVNRFCPHELRHSYATDLIDLGVSPRKLQPTMGHSSFTITENYCHDMTSKSVEDVFHAKYAAPAPEII